MQVHQRPAAYRVALLVLLCLPFLILVYSLWPDTIRTPPLKLFDSAMRQRFMASVWLGLWSALFSTLLGLLMFQACRACPPKLKICMYGLSLVPIAIPPFAVATAWLTFASWSEAVEGGRLLLDSHNVDWLNTAPGIGFILALCYWPVTCFLLVLNARPSKAGHDAAMLYLSSPNYCANVFWPAVRPPLVMAFCLIFCLGMIQFEVPSLFQYKAYPLEIYIRVSALLERAAGLWLSLPYIALAIVMALVVYLYRGVPVNTVLTLSPVRPFWQRGFYALAAFVILVLSIGVPLAGLLLHSFSVEAWKNIFELLNTTFTSITYAGPGAAVLLLLSLWFTAKPTRGVMYPAIIMGFIFLFLPGIMTGSALLQTRSLLPGYVPPLVQILSLIAGIVITYWLVGLISARLCWHYFGSGAREAARLSISSSFKRIIFLYIPSLFQPLLLLAIVIAMLAWQSVAKSTLLHPPGGETLAMRYFSLLHYGSEPRTAAVGLMMILTPIIIYVLLLSLFAFINRRSYH